MGNSAGKTENKRHSRKHHNRTMRRGGAKGKGTKLTAAQIEDIVKFEKTNKYPERSEKEIHDMPAELKKLYFDVPETAPDKKVWLRRNITTFQIAEGRSKK